MKRKKTREKEFDLRRGYYYYYNNNTSAKQNEVRQQNSLLAKLSKDAYASSQNDNHTGAEHWRTILVSNKALHARVAKN